MSINKITNQDFLINHRMSFFIEKIDSTNLWAKKEFLGQWPFALFLADEQTQGRGRGNNTWSQSKPGDTLLSTWCLSLHTHPQPLFPLRVGLLLFESCQKTWSHLPWALKAPNDIYLGEGDLAGKWAGILVEIAQNQNTVCAYIGIGANVLSAPQNITQKTSALVEHTSFEENSWLAFSYAFYEGLLQIQKDPARLQLTTAEIHSLQQALQKYHGNNIETVLPDGSLKLTSGKKTHWSEL